MPLRSVTPREDADEEEVEAAINKEQRRERDEEGSKDSELGGVTSPEAFLFLGSRGFFFSPRTGGRRPRKYKVEITQS